MLSPTCQSVSHVLYRYGAPSWRGRHGPTIPVTRIGSDLAKTSGSHIFDMVHYESAQSFLGTLQKVGRRFLMSTGPICFRGSLVADGRMDSSLHVRSHKCSQR